MHCKEEVSRKCIVTREILPKSSLIRFVLGPDNQIYPDIEGGKLPGKGIWVKANKSILQKAVKSGSFAKAHGCAVTVTQVIVDLVNNLLKQKCFDILGLCNKAGLVITGYEKVKHVLKNEQNSIYLKAVDSNAEPVSKNNLYNIFANDELAKLLGKENVVHIAVKSGGLTKKLIEAMNKFISYNEIII